MKYVMMPVMCIDKFCTNCPNIELKTETTVQHLFAAGSGEEFIEYSNCIFCAKWRQCERLMDYFKECKKHAAEDG